MPAKLCRRCGQIILGNVSIVEVSRVTHRGAELETHVLCEGCTDAVRSYLACRPTVALEPVALEPAGAGSH